MVIENKTVGREVLRGIKECDSLNLDACHKFIEARRICKLGAMDGNHGIFDHELEQVR